MDCWGPRRRRCGTRPHTLDDLVDAKWARAYSREQAVFPTRHTRTAKYWPTVNRVDNVYGDRNFFCSCPPVEEYADFELSK